MHLNLQILVDLTTISQMGKTYSVCVNGGNEIFVFHLWMTWSELNDELWLFVYKSEYFAIQGNNVLLCFITYMLLEVIFVFFPGLFSLRKKIEGVVLQADMLAPAALELEEASRIRQEEMIRKYNLWDDVTKSNEILGKLADSSKVVDTLKDLTYKVMCYSLVEFNW